MSDRTRHGLKAQLKAGARLLMATLVTMVMMVILLWLCVPLLGVTIASRQGVGGLRTGSS